MSTTVALAGATGKIGPFILEQLLLAGFKVIVLTRKESTSTDIIIPHQNLQIRKVDWHNIRGLTMSLDGADIVVSTLTASATGNRETFIEAAVTAGVKRFIPAEFSVDVETPKNRILPVFQAKLETQEYLKQTAETHPNFSYTLMYTNVWLDWGIQAGFILDLKGDMVPIYDGGNDVFSTTTRTTVGRAVVAVINNLAATKNRSIRIHDAAVTQNQLLDMVSRIKSREFVRLAKKSSEVERQAYAETDAFKAMRGFQSCAALTHSYGPDFTGRTDNALLGLPELSASELEDVVRESLPL